MRMFSEKPKWMRANCTTLGGISSGGGKRRSRKNTFNSTKMPRRCEALRGVDGEEFFFVGGGEVTLQFDRRDWFAKPRIGGAFNRWHESSNRNEQEEVSRGGVLITIARPVYPRWQHYKDQS